MDKARSLATQLSPDAQAVLEHLARSGRGSTSFVAAGAGIPEPEAHAALRELKQLSLAVTGQGMRWTITTAGFNFLRDRGIV